MDPLFVRIGNSLIYTNGLSASPKKLMREFIADHPALWNEDIG